jgi:pilus assembly protein CpaF
MVLMAGIDLPSRAIREQVSSALQLLVHVRRFEDGVRRIETISEMTGLEGNTPLLQDIFMYRRHGRQGRRLIGEFQSNGIVPHFIEDLRQRGIEVPLEWFKRRTGDGV